MLTDFKKFLMRGNVLDLAIAVVMGAAFSPIISSLVDKIIMPPIGLILGGVDFSELAITLKEATADTEAVVIGYGAFIQAVINFIIIAACIFAVIKLFEKMQKKQEEAPASPPKPSDEVILLTEIRDILKK